MNRTARIALCLALLFTTSTTFAEVPQSICVQGYLEDLAGQQVDAQVTFGVCIFDAATGGNQVWPAVPLAKGDNRGFFPSRAREEADRVPHLSRSERWGTDSTPAPCAQITTIVSDGLFTICPGEPNDPPITPDVFGATGSGPQPRWIEISTGGQPMQPRIELHTSPYASRVGLVDNPELTDNVELGSSTPGNPGSLTAFDSAGNQTISLHGTTGDAHFAGTVGIGMTSPAAQLDINGATRTTTLEIKSGTRLAQPVPIWGGGAIPYLLDVPSGTFTAVAAGSNFSLAIRSDGSVVGWGANNYGQTNVPAGTYVAIAAGEHHALGIRSDGTLGGWGDDPYGETNVPAGTFIGIAAGSYHSVAIRSDGTLVGWGYDFEGETDVPSGTFVSVAAGYLHSLAIRTDGTLVGWGWGPNGQIDVPSGTFIAVAAGSEHSIAIRSDGTLAGWGDNASGQISVPPGTYTAVAARDRHTIAIRSDGMLVGWGDNTYGQLNIPSGTFTAVATGTGYGLGIRNDQSAKFGLLLDTDSAAKPGSNTWTIWSDRRLKTNIQPLSGALDRMLQLRGVTFNWIDPAYGGKRVVPEPRDSSRAPSVNPRWARDMNVAAQEDSSPAPTSEPLHSCSAPSENVTDRRDGARDMNVAARNDARNGNGAGAVGSQGAQMGLIADEVARVFPQWVGRDPKGYQTLTVGGFEALTAESLRELRNEKDAAIEKLERENANLRAQGAELKARDAELRGQSAELRELVRQLSDRIDALEREK
ncbi:MAG: tail fiber domain-containing protein [Planctomycetes bacterium]|nr:tail fiber domain-containing protein [Planctomycetota bacterium]MBI3833674.1 tail fiber domain-containing protein [Planctomycetota bacterium]